MPRGPNRAMPLQSSARRRGRRRGGRRSLLTASCVCVWVCAWVECAPQRSAVHGLAPPPQWAEGSAGTRCTRVPCEVLGEYFVKASEAVWKRSLLSPSAPPRLHLGLPCGVLCEYFVRASEAVGKRSVPFPLRSPWPTRVPCGVLGEYFRGGAGARCRPLPFAYSGTPWGTR